MTHRPRSLNVFSQRVLLRDTVGQLLEHLAAGGLASRNDAWFNMLRGVHAETRDYEPDDTFYLNVACGWAFDCGMLAARLDGSWAVLLDMMLERGGELGDDARALAAHLGIELRESRDGGETWVPVQRVSTLREFSDEALQAEVRRRGLYPGENRAGWTQEQVDQWNSRWTHICDHGLAVRLPADRDCGACGRAPP